jgi:hypothetical protein
MPKLSAPDYGGVWSWDGELLPSTIIRLSNGAEVSLSSIITQTNGDVLEWLEEQQIDSPDETSRPNNPNKNQALSIDLSNFDFDSDDSLTQPTEKQ